LGRPSVAGRWDIGSLVGWWAVITTWANWDVSVDWGLRSIRRWCDWDWDVGWDLWDIWSLGWLSWAIGGGDCGGITIVLSRAGGGVDGQGLGWVGLLGGCARGGGLSWVLDWGLIGWDLGFVAGWCVVNVGGVYWRNVVLGSGGVTAGGDAVSGGGIDLSWAGSDILAAAGDGDLLV